MGRTSQATRLTVIAAAQRAKETTARAFCVMPFLDRAELDAVGISGIAKHSCFNFLASFLSLLIIRG